MSDSLVPPPAGWYPAPNGSGEQWWWDGTAWAQPQPAQPAQPAEPEQPVQAQPWQQQPSQQPWQQQASQQPWQQQQAQPRNTETIRRLSMATQILLWVSAGFSLITIFVEFFGLSVINGYLNDLFLPEGNMVGYAGLSSLVAILAVLVLIATGICWVIWQFQVAQQVAGLTRRTPGWHIGSWFIPVVSFWFPYQNISDLWKAVRRPQPSWQLAWWLLWLGGGIVSQISSRIVMDSYTVESWRVAMYSSIGAEVLTLAAVPFACLILRGITDGLRNLPAYAVPAARH